MANPFASVGPNHNSFLPEDYIKAKSESRANILTLGLFAVTLACVLGAFVVTKGMVQSVQARKARVNEQFSLAGKKIDQLKSLESQQAQMMEKAEITSALIEKVPRWAVLGEITLRMPTDMKLELLQVKSTRTEPPKPPPPTKATPSQGIKSLTSKVANAVKGEQPKEPERPKPQVVRFDYALIIEGSALRNNDVADFLASLKRSPVLDKVDMPYIREQRDGDRELRKFQITATIKNSLDTKVLADSLKTLVAERAAALATRHDPAKPVADAPETPQTPQTPVTQAKE
jgi:Tfp pilus assembly protein PilN